MAAREFYITANLTAATAEGQLSQAASAVSSGATAVEVHLDLIESFSPDSDLPLLLSSRTVPVIVSFRSKSQGGSFEGDDKFRHESLGLAYKLGADFIQIELESAKEFIAGLSPSGQEVAPLENGIVSKKTRVIAAAHFLEDTPSEEALLEVAGKLQETGADVIKIITFAKDISDNKKLFNLLGTVKAPTIAIALGERGEISRTLAAKYGSFLTYSYSVEEGQLPTIHDFTKVYQGQRFTAATKVFGVIGKPISQSRGFLLYNAAMIEKGFDGVYLPFLVDDVELFFKTFTDFAGFSVTAPHKQWAIKLIDKVDPAAISIGAVSAIFRESDGTLTGYNMDWEAAIYAVEEGLKTRESLPKDGPYPLKDRILVLVGAGGAGRGLAYGSQLLGGKLVVADLDQSRAEEVASTFGGSTITLEELRQPNSAKLVTERFGANLTKDPVLTHATPVGMKPNVDKTPFTFESLGGYAVVFDAVYNPAETRLQREAVTAGATPVSGVEMFIREAEEQFTLFTSGIPAPGQVMREVLLENLKN